MAKTFFKIIRYLLLLGIGIFLLWLTFKGQDIEDIFQKIKHAHFGYISLSLICGFLAFYLRAVRWNMLIEPLGYTPKNSNAAYALGLGYFANLAIPRIGEITRCGALSKAEKVPFEKLIGTVITERLIDLITLVCTMMLAALFQFQLLKNFILEKIIHPVENSSAGRGENNTAILIFVFLFCLALGIFILRSKKTATLRNKIINLFKGVVDGLKSVFIMKRKSIFVLYTVIIWFLYFLAVYVCFFSMQPTSHLTVKEGLFILIAGGLGMSAPVQGGIGAYHYIVSQALLLFGVSLTDGIAFATLVHTYQTLLVIVIGIVSMFMLVRINKSKNISNA